MMASVTLQDQAKHSQLSCRAQRRRKRYKSPWYVCPLEFEYLLQAKNACPVGTFGLSVKKSDGWKGQRPAEILAILWIRRKNDTPREKPSQW